MKEKNNFLVVMYHHINENKKYFNSITYSEFKKQVDYLNLNYNILSPDEFFLKFKEKKITNKDCILTFDDGYHSHYKYVFKYLKKKNLKAFFFPLVNKNNKFGLHNINKTQVIINLLKKNKKKINIVNNILKKNKIVLSNIISNKSLNKNLNSYYDKDILKIRLVLQKIFPYELRTTIINNIYKNIINIKFKNFYCSLKQLKEIKSFGNIIGPHTCNHDWLSSVSYQKQKIEICSSFNFFFKNKLIDKNNWFFSYPFGNYNSNTLKILEQKKCSLAFLAGDKFAEVLKSKFLIQRIDCKKVKGIK